MDIPLDTQTGQQVDPEKQKQARQYARISRRLLVVDLALGVLYALAWLFFGWSAALGKSLQGLLAYEWLRVLAYVAVFGGFYYLLDLPLSYYSGFILPHRFGLSNQSLREWIMDELKGLAVGAVLGGIVLEVIYAVLRLAPDTWWLWAAVFMLVFNVLLANLAPVLLFPIFNKFTPLGEEHAELVGRLKQLAERAGSPVEGVYQFDMSRRTKAANAAFTGLGRTRRIILGDTLLNEFSIDEIETVMAHELGHQVNKDIPLGIVVQSLMTLVGLYLAGLGLRLGVAYFGFAGVADVAAFPVLLLVIGLFGLVTMPLGNAFSRWRERRADVYALHITGKGQAYASALARLANQNLAEADPEPWVEWLLYSHPALKKRIEMAERS